MSRLLTVCFVLAACGGDSLPVDATPLPDQAPAIPDASTPDADTSAFVLSSSALGEGGVFAPDLTCAGANTSPPLTWTAWPAASGYALVFTDRSSELIHWVIHDLPASTLALPADVDKSYAPADVPGAHQPLSYDNATRGYLGPCPGNQHTYAFEILALDVATVPGATMSSTRAQLAALLDGHVLARADLTGTYTPP